MQALLILASQSPRRQELLRLLELPFRTLSVPFDEAQVTADILSREAMFQDFAELAGTLVEALAQGKATHAGRTLHGEEAREAVILAADTIVVLDREILGKPQTPEEATAMLRKLCGRTHHVYTGVCLQQGESQRRERFHVRSAVEFYPEDARTEEWIARYVSSGSPLDKAGGYGIQDQGALFVRGISGDYYNIMGLPLAETARRLARFLTGS